MSRRKHSTVVSNDEKNTVKISSGKNVFAALANVHSDNECSDSEEESVVSNNSSNNKPVEASNKKEKNLQKEEKEIYKAPPTLTADGWNFVSTDKRKSKKKDKKKSLSKEPVEKATKELFNQIETSEEMLQLMGDDKSLNSKWNVSIHATDKLDWGLDSYEHIYSFDTIGKFWRFFNNFHLLDKINNQLFIMRDGVTPRWEDLNNRNGAICSFKIDYYNKGGRNDIGSEIMTCISILVINESFVSNNACINGISYSIRNRSIMIKLWVKDYSSNKKFTEKLPLEFLNKIDHVLKLYDTGRRYNSSSKISIQFKEIVPEYAA